VDRANDAIEAAMRAAMRGDYVGAAREAARIRSALSARTSAL
jgi:hypothetical protein